MVVYFATGNLSPNWPASPSANFAKGGQGGRRNFRRGRLFRSGRTPIPPCSIAEKAWYPQNEWHGMVRTFGCNACGCAAHQVAVRGARLRQLSRARWRRGLPSSPASMQHAPTAVGAASLWFGKTNRLLHQEAPLWKDRHGLSETKRACQGAGGSGAHSIAA